MYSNVKKWMLVIWRNKNQNEGATSTFFLLSIFFKFETSTVFPFEYIQDKRPQIKKYRLKSKSMWSLGKKKLLAGEFFYHFPTGGEFFHFTSFLI